MDRWESYKSDTGATWTDKILTNTPENIFLNWSLMITVVRPLLIQLIYTAIMSWTVFWWNTYPLKRMNSAQMFI